MDQDEIRHEEERVQQRLVEVDRPVFIFAPLLGRCLLECRLDFVDLPIAEDQRARDLALARKGNSAFRCLWSALIDSADEVEGVPELRCINRI